MEKLVNTIETYRAVAEFDRNNNGIIPTRHIGLIWNGPDDGARCGTCDSRNCGTNCHAAEGTVYVVTFGYRAEAHAKQMEALGAEVRWNDRGIVPPLNG